MDEGAIGESPVFAITVETPDGHINALQDANAATIIKLEAALQKAHRDYTAINSKIGPLMLSKVAVYHYLQSHPRDQAAHQEYTKLENQINEIYRQLKPIKSNIDQLQKRLDSAHGIAHMYSPQPAREDQNAEKQADDGQRAPETTSATSQTCIIL
jgi:hypothetical protein